MAKEPNLLNNLFRRLRERLYPGATIKSIAEKIGVPASTLTKIENGEMENPNDESFEKLLKFYGQPREWGDTLVAVWKLAKAGNLPSDESMVTLPAATRLVPSAISLLGTAASALPGRSFSYHICGPGFTFTPKMPFNHTKRGWVAAESLLTYLTGNPRSAKTVTDFFFYRPDWCLFEASRHPLIARCPGQVVYVDGVLVAFQTFDEKWAVTANEQVLRTWGEAVDAVPAANGESAVSALNLIINRLTRVRPVPTAPSSSDPFAPSHSPAASLADNG